MQQELDALASYGLRGGGGGVALFFFWELPTRASFMDLNAKP